ncbi:hypothetical protein FACS1894130_00220 [Spirochaetia bacterium]|nr:hypothetical protein FACS1894130_00220 [Spirochaetia bacterium]
MPGTKGCKGNGMNTVWEMKKQQPLAPQCQTGVVSVSQNGEWLVYAMADTGFDVGGALVGVMSYAFTGGTATAINALSKALSTKDTGDSIFSSINDGKMQKFLNSLSFPVIGGVEGKDEAIAVARGIASGVLIYDQKGLAKKGINQNDWTKAVKDRVLGQNNPFYRGLYDNVMAGKYD